MTRDELRAKLEEAKVKIQAEMEERGIDLDDLRENLRERFGEHGEQLKDMRDKLAARLTELENKTDEEIVDLKEDFQQGAEKAKSALMGFINRLRDRDDDQKS